MKKIVYKRGVIVEESKRASEEIEIDRSALGSIDGADPGYSINGSELYVGIRGEGQFERQALYLSDVYEWVLCEDDENSICLIPLKKENK